MGGNWAKIRRQAARCCPDSGSPWCGSVQSRFVAMTCRAALAKTNADTGEVTRLGTEIGLVRRTRDVLRDQLNASDLAQDVAGLGHSGSRHCGSFGVDLMPPAG
jgi:hypothetical protein